MGNSAGNKAIAGGRVRIFLAHAREDKSQVRKLYADLTARGLDPWLDEIELIPGQIWREEIPKAIRQAGIFLACLSSRSVGKVGYVQNEFRLALSAFGERPPRSIFLIPVRLDDCDVPDLQIPERGLSLQAFHWVDLWHEGGFDRLVRAIEHALGIATPAKASREEVRPRTPPPEREAEHLTWKRTMASQMASATQKETQARAKATDVKLSAGGEPKPDTGFGDIDEPWCPELVEIPPGKFMMGYEERPQHEVRIGYRLAVARYPVTFDEYDRFAAKTGRGQPNDQKWGRGRRPVIDVSWNDAKAYVTWLSKEVGQPYRLLSEAEWEYACRAGTTTRYSWGDKITWRNANYGAKRRITSEVGDYSANPWGLHDMHGNVWEWVEDCWNESYQGAPSAGSAWTSGDCSRRVLRGGSWFNGPKDLRSASRVRLISDGPSNLVGFRVARTGTW